MKRLLFTAVALLVSASAFSQQALGPASGITSPEINPDHSVTFRYRGPKAVTVQLQGDFLPGRVDMKEGRDGMWTYTTEPLAGELYSYSFIVDGVRTMDPNNIYQNRDIATWTNIFTLSAEKGDKGW
ncbi:MAG: esterase, partial [Bacteroidales bacterium]|nr:esterase [Bacteroidales bacterium]